jgi:FkbM family methyltransferase
MASESGNRNYNIVNAALLVLARLFGNPVGQEALESMSKGILFMMGIGAGAGVSTSGEREVLRRARQNVQSRNKFVVFDVGANKGDYIELAIETAEMQPLVVHAFEPSAVAIERLKSRWGSRDDIVLNCLALGKTSGLRSLYSDSPGSTLASLTKRDLRHVDLEMSYSEEVRVETLDDYCIAKTIPTIDLLKVDVEGNELEVFHGAEGLLRKGGIRMATFEFGGTDIDSRVYFRDFFYFFRDHAMDVYRITPTGYLKKLTRYSEFCEQFRTTNFVAIRSSAR